MENNTTFRTDIEDVQPISTQTPKSSGIPLSAEFNLNAQKPLDDRQFVFTLEERNAMPAIRRWEGMTVFVAEGEGITYQLKGGITNDNWVKFGTSHASDVDGLHAIATSGDYNDLENTPTKLSQFDNDTQFITLDDVPTDIAYGIEQPEDKHKNLWFDVQSTNDVVTDEVGVFLKSPSDKKFKLCVTGAGRLYAQQVDADPGLFKENIIVMSETNVRFKVCVTDEGRVFAEEAE